MNSYLKRLHFAICALVFTSLPVLGQAQPNTAKAARFFHGSSTEPNYSAFVIPLDHQKGVQLDPVSRAPWEANQSQSYYPWFFKISTHSRYLASPGGTNSINYSLMIQNPIAAFGSEAGGTPLYVGQSYRFGFYAGAQYSATDFPAEARIQVFSKSGFQSATTPQEPVYVDNLDLPHLKDVSADGLTADWKSFGDHGFQRTFVTSISGVPVLETTVQFAMAQTSDSAWGVSFYAPLLITHKALEGAQNYYFTVSYTGCTKVGTTINWMTVADPNDPDHSGDELPGYAMNFESFPAWGSTLLKTPSFQGDPAPPTYYGKTAEEIAAMSPRFDVVLADKLKDSNGNSVTTPAATAYKQNGQSPELQIHPLLEKLVNELGSNPLSIANYVHNEIGLTDALGYNETGDLDETSVNAAGVNRGALGTYLEGQGSPEEQCALLVYLLRRAGYQTAYVKPPHSLANGVASSPVKMLDQRLSNLLRMRIKNAMTPDGHTPVPQFVGVNYPWVAAYLPSDPNNSSSAKKWIHLFPWLKDTEVIEGKSVEGYLPSDTKSVREWVRKFVFCSKTQAPLNLDAENRTPGNIFYKDLQKNLQEHWQGISMDDIGVRFRDRRFNRPDWEQFPQPCYVDASKSYTLSETLSADGKAFDTMNITIASVQNPSKQITISGIRTMDFHNRRAIVNFAPNGSNRFTLSFVLQPFDLTSTTGTGDFSYASDPFLSKKQVKTLAVDTTDLQFKFSVVYNRHRTYPGKTGTDNSAILGGWSSFLGISEFDSTGEGAAAPGAEIVSYFKLGDLNAFCVNAGRVTEKMVQVHLEPFWKHQQDRTKNPTTVNPDYDLIQGTTAYLMGMTYYQRVSDSVENLKNLFKVNIASMRAHGFAQLGADRSSGVPKVSTVTLTTGGTTQRIRQIYPVVDMNFFRGAWAGYGDLRADAGGQQMTTGADFITNLMVIEQSALEDHTIRQYFKRDDADAVSTMDLFRRIQSDDSASNNIIELTADNYLTYKTKKYEFNDKKRTLQTWAGENTWNQVEGAFTGWDRELVRVYITPGPVKGAKEQWEGMGTLILGKDKGAALIGQVLNGGYGSYSPLMDYSNSVYSGYTVGNMTLAYSSGYLSATTSDWAAGWSTTSSAAYSSWPTSSLSQNYTSSTLAAMWSYSSPWNATIGSDYSQAYYGSSSISSNPMLSVFSQGSLPVGDIRSYSGYGLYAADPVNMLTGEMYADEVDLQLAGPIPLQVRRNYGSKVTTYGSFGHGWKMSYFPYLFLNNTETEIHAAELDGSVILYRRNSANTTQQEWTVTAADNPLLTNGKGVDIGSSKNLFRNRIVRTPAANGNPATYVLYGVDGSVRSYEVRSYPVYGATPAITRERPYLKKWTDSVGNRLDFYFYGDKPADGTANPPGTPWDVSETHSSYGQLAMVKASNGNTLGFHYDTTGRILDIYTGDGRRVSYRYDTDGDLREVTLPDNSWVKYDYLREQGIVDGEKYAWYSTHLINRETRPGGRIVETDYQTYVSSGQKNKAGKTIAGWQVGKASHLGRVIEQRATVGEHTGSASRDQPAAESYKPVVIAKFTYVNNTESDLTSGRTEVLDAYNRRTVYYYTNSRLTKVADPMTTLTNVEGGIGSNFKLEQSWYAAADVPSVSGAWAGALRSIQERGGLRTEYMYNSEGDATQIKVIGELDGDATTVNDTAVTTISYNPITHLPEWVVYPNPSNGTASGAKSHFSYTDTARPYHVTAVEQQSPSGAVLDRTTSVYEDVYSAPGDLNSPFSKGVLKESRKAQGTADEAVTVWTNAPSGFRLGEIKYSGGSSPDLVTQYDYNLRGELVEERIMESGVAKKANRYAYDDMGRKIWVERLDAARKQVAWDYTYYNKTGEVEWTDGSKSNPEDYTYTRYDGAGRPVEKTSVRSRAKANGSGVEAVPGEEAYETSKCFYNQFGDLIKTMDGRGNTVKATYDNLGRVVTKTAYEGDWEKQGVALANETTTYNDSTLSVSTTDTRGGITTIYYTSAKKPYKQINPDGTVLQWRYLFDGRAKSEPQSPYAYKQYEYNDNARKVVTSLCSASGAVLGTTTEIKDSRGNTISYEDVAGLAATASYDKLDRLISYSIPLSSNTSAAQSQTLTYDAAGYYKKSVNGLGEATEVTSDALERPLLSTVKNSSGTIVSQSQNEYSADFQSVTSTSGSGSGALTTTKWTDNKGNGVLEKFADGKFVLTAYDAVGNAVAQTDEGGLTTRTSYDGLNRPVLTSLPDGGATTFVYTYLSGGGERVERRMAENLTEVNTFDSAGRASGSYLRGSDNSVTRSYSNYQYYSSGKDQGLIERFTDPNGLVHSLAYDTWSRLQSVTIGSPGSSRYVKQEYAYDMRGMFTSLLETTTPSGTAQTQVSKVDRLYDLQGHLYDEKVSLGTSAGQLTVATHLTAIFNAAGRRSALSRGSGVNLLASGGAAAGGSWGFAYRADGLLAGVTSGGGVFSSNYGDNGLLLSRINPFRTHAVTARDNRGRILNTSTYLPGGTNTLADESITWTQDGKQATYTINRLSSANGTGANSWIDNRGYSYNTESRRLSSESYTPALGQASKAINYEFDHDKPGGLGIRTSSYSGSGATLHGHGVGSGGNSKGWNSFGRVTDEVSGYEKISMSAQGTSIGAKRIELYVGDNGSLDGVDYPADTRMTTGTWGRNLSLPSGGIFNLTGVGVHPSELSAYSVSAGSSFAVGVRHFGVVNNYDDEGALSGRTVAGGLATGGRSQTLTWDGAGRLIKVVQDEAAGFGFVWTAVYDGLNRRIETKTKWTGSAAAAGQAAQQDVVQRSWYDPAVEFLEVGLQVIRSNQAGTVTSNERWWKVHGPDLNGGYGGLQGLGGLEAMINETTGEAVGMIDDAGGTVLGFSKALKSGTAAGFSYPTATKTFEWNQSRFGGYGPLPGQWAPAVEDLTAVWRSHGWRGKRVDITGFYAMGARYYEPNSGRFLSPDPLGHAASAGLYDYAGGDPINFVDPRGRSAVNIAASSISSSSFMSAAMSSPGSGIVNSMAAARYSSGTYGPGYTYSTSGVWGGSATGAFSSALPSYSAFSLGNMWDSFTRGFAEGFTWENAVKGVVVGVVIGLLGPEIAAVAAVVGIAMMTHAVLTSDDPAYTLGNLAGGTLAGLPGGILGGGAGSMLRTAVPRLNWMNYSVDQSIVSSGMPIMKYNAPSSIATKSLGNPAGKLSYDAAAKSWTSPGGLVYGQGSAQGNRLLHVLEHTVPNPAKPVHSVFDASRNQVVGLVDEAWAARTGSGTLQANGNRVWDIDLGRQIGTAGQTGVRIVIRDGTTEIITAFPK